MKYSLSCFGIALLVGWAITACGGTALSQGAASPQQQLRATASRAVPFTANTPTVDQLLNWAERRYPDLLSPRTVTARSGPYLYRYYAHSDLYIGVSDGVVYALGPTVTNGGIVPIGNVRDYAASVTAESPTPLPVLRSAYENRVFAGEMLGPVLMPPSELPPPYERITGAIAFADFFGEGAQSAVAFSAREDEGSLSGQQPSWTAGRVYFYRLLDGAWKDSTTSILSDTTGCIGAGRLSVADFNGDGRPDLFASCSGHDAVVDGKLPGEHPRLLLSRSDGTYDNVEFPLVCFCSATAADIRGDGYADIVLNDTRNEGMLYFTNNRDGTFTADRAQLPASTLWFGPAESPGPFTHPISTVELLDAYGTGIYDLFAGGADFECDCNFNWRTTLYRNDGNNRWSDADVMVLPSVPFRTDIYDVLVRDRKVYMLRWDWGGSNASADDSMAIQEVDLDTLASSVLYDHVGTFPGGLKTTILWLIFNAGQVMGVYSDPPITVPQ